MFYLLTYVCMFYLLSANACRTTRLLNTYAKAFYISMAPYWSPTEIYKNLTKSQYLQVATTAYTDVYIQVCIIGLYWNRCSLPNRMPMLCQHLLSHEQRSDVVSAKLLTKLILLQHAFITNTLFFDLFSTSIPESETSFQFISIPQVVSFSLYQFSWFEAYYY